MSEGEWFPLASHNRCCFPQTDELTIKYLKNEVVTWMTNMCYYFFYLFWCYCCLAKLSSLFILFLYNTFGHSNDRERGPTTTLDKPGHFSSIVPASLCHHYISLQPPSWGDVWWKEDRSSPFSNNGGVKLYQWSRLLHSVSSIFGCHERVKVWESYQIPWGRPILIWSVGKREARPSSWTGQGHHKKQTSS